MTDHRKTAVYIRLSAEDDNVDGRAKKESDSVTSQRILLKSFVIDQLGVAEADILEYVDDGVSGTHFKRQGFQQLQDDMKSGEIGCVVVKDFSRFGRDYLEVGFYIEYIFPLLQIRFISINDSYDSAASSGMTGGMNVALQNLVYNMYSLDLSKKISSALQTRTRNGTRLPVNARYGYKKRNRASAEMLRCPNQWRFCVPKSGDPARTDGGEYPWACLSACSVNVGKRKESIFQQAMRLQRDQYRRIAKTEPTVDLGKDETL